MDVDFSRIAELAVMGALNVAASMAAIRARLHALDKRCDSIEKEADRANLRIDSFLLRGTDK